ncbi:MAG TPA: hypothetical protein VGF85_02660 [Opitutaceae bacterium]|jgi:hypothetical protein
MNIADELKKLADLRREGSLSDTEFANAKRRLLADVQLDGETPPFVEAPPAGTAFGSDQIFKSSRWSSGNLLFPDSLTVSGDGILFRKGKLFGSSEERIGYKAIASVRVKNGVFLCTLSVETSGGSQPIYINGLWKSDGRKILEAIREYQHAG